eukprot:g14381.t1
MLSSTRGDASRRPRLEGTRNKGWLTESIPPLCLFLELAEVQVFLTDGDRAMTAALRGWKTTLHLYCLWHIFKNVLKNCGSSFPDINERSRMLGLFGSAAYAATPEAFNKHSADLERTVAGKACAEYIQDLIEDKTKWAFSCRPTVMTLGMAATQLSEGLFGVAKRAGVDKSLSLCALWEKLQSVNKSLEIASASLGTRAIAAERPFQVAHLDKFFDPVKVEHERVGASQICQRDLRDELGGSQSYEVEIVASGAAGDDSSPLPLGNDRLRQAVHGAQQNRNAFQEAPPLTDLEQDSKHGSYAQTTDDTTPWGRTSSSTFLDLLGNVPIHLVILVRYKLTRTKQSHIVVFGPNNFHLCSCLKLLRLGLPCRHYFAALLRFLDGVYRGQSLGHDFHGSSVHNRWRKSPDGNDEPWSVSSVLQEAGLGKDWDGRDEGLDDNYEGPTFDDDCGGEGVHPAEREGRATQRKACDQRRVFATMMAKSKENVGEILKAVPFDQALHIQAEVDKYVRYLLADADGDTKTKNPAPVKPPGAAAGQIHRRAVGTDDVQMVYSGERVEEVPSVDTSEVDSSDFASSSSDDTRSAESYVVGESSDEESVEPPKKKTSLDKKHRGNAKQAEVPKKAKVSKEPRVKVPKEPKVKLSKEPKVKLSKEPRPSKEA